MKREGEIAREMTQTQMQRERERDRDERDARDERD